MPVRRRWLIEGRVQGVGFREFTRREARRIGGLMGYVRNLDDGRVEVVAEGEPEPIERLRSYLGRGPFSARVDRVEDAAIDPAAPLSGFEIRR